MRLIIGAFVPVLMACLAASALAAAPTLDERPARAGEWGYRPAHGARCEVNPPRFSWRPQRGAHRYEVQADPAGRFEKPVYRATDIRYNVHCSAKTLRPGTWAWRFRYVDAKGQPSAWSRARTFTLPPGVPELPLPARADLLARVPKGHPRLFVRPEDLARLRELARGEMKADFAALVKRCDALLRKPPPTAEPPKYPPGTKSHSETWRKIWWGNRVYTQKVLDGAATLAFTHLLGGKRAYADLARRLLMDAAQWDPKGATGYRYNDEAGMPYAYYFSRTYTFVYPLLSEAEREQCRRVMAVRGREMYDHLSRRHLWQPYSSHSNRAWHFLGEVGIAFLGEIPEAEEWLWFAMNVFANVYPVWSDTWGGWHEGMAYWRSYLGRFTWWADVMRAAVKIDAYRLPYFSQVGFYAMYLQPPGTRGGGFGDLTARLRSSQNTGLMTVLAAQSGNRYWQWYVEAHGGPKRQGGYIGFVRGALPKVTPKPPTDLPTSVWFCDTGQAVLNTTLLDAKDNVSVIFKASPFGTISHGYESQNSFLLYAFGERLLIRTGRRDIYGSDHHKNWMWHTKSTNCITVDGQGQTKHSWSGAGRISDFATGKQFDFVQGEAGDAYAGRLERFTRSILFVKPDLIVILDRLAAPRPATFAWHLHAPTKMSLAGQHDIRLSAGRAGCRVNFLAPAGLKLTQTDKFDPPPRPRVKLTEYHLTAQLAKPAEPAKPAKEMCFVTVIRPHRKGQNPPAGETLKPITGGYVLTAPLAGGGKAVVLLRAEGQSPLSAAGLSTTHDVAAAVLDAKGRQVASFRSN